MKKILFLSVSFIFFITLTVQAQSEIIHQDYGDGLAFPINQTANFDFNGDGMPDIYINSVMGQLGIKPIYLEGCVHAYEQFDANVGGIRIRVLQEGDPINYGGTNSLHFEEDNVLPLYGGDGVYEDWQDNEAKYIGLLGFDGARPAWMKIRVDITTETLYILSYGFLTESHGEILAGQTELSPVGIEELKNISSLNVFPNPVNELLKIDLELSESSTVEFSLKTMNGQQVRLESCELNPGTHQERLDVADLANGIYQLVVRSNGEYITRSITIAK